MVNEVYLDDTATPEEIAAVRDVFERYGIDAPVEANYMRKSAGVLPWLVHVAIDTAVGDVLKHLARYAASGVKDWAKEIWRARQASTADRGSITLQDTEGTVVVIPSGLEDDAFDALAHLDWDDARGHYLTWDHVERKWRDRIRG
jgi:hypothetical protein